MRQKIAQLAAKSRNWRWSHEGLELSRHRIRTIRSDPQHSICSTIEAQIMNRIMQKVSPTGLTTLCLTSDAIFRLCSTRISALFGRINTNFFLIQFQNDSRNGELGWAERCSAMCEDEWMNSFEVRLDLLSEQFVAVGKNNGRFPRVICALCFTFFSPKCCCNLSAFPIHYSPLK